MNLIRDILSAMTVDEVGQICDRWAKAKTKASLDLTFEDKEEMEIYITDKSYMATQVIRRFVNDGIYSLPKGALFKVTK